MGSFYAELHIDGRAYPVLRCDFSVHQDTDGRGRVTGKVRHGPLYLTLDVPRDGFLMAWAATAHKPLPGRVVFYDATAQVPHESIAFAAGECVGYGEDFHNGNTGPGAYLCQLTITAPAFELLAGGPSARAAGVAAAAVRTAVPAPAAPSLTSTPGLPAAPDWLADLETVLGPAAGVRSLVATWIASGLSEPKLKSALRGAVDQRLIFERLVKASTEKGLYHQRVHIGDYDNIPGVTKVPYGKGNSLPKQDLIANDFLSDDEKAELAKSNRFGANNEELNLPDYRTETFTKEAKLVKLKPNTSLYRVTDPGGEGGPWWTLEKPKDLAEVIGGTAVKPEWNGFTKVVQATVPDDGEPFYVWSGPAAAQEVFGASCPDQLGNGHSLAGGTEQVFLPNIVKNNSKFKATFQDSTSTLKSW